MMRLLMFLAPVALGVLAGGVLGPPVAAQTLAAPASISADHEELIGTLRRAAREPGALGRAGGDLLAVLQPHFRREEEIATPPLALLAPLARGGVERSMERVLPMTRALERELPQMLAEHRRIGAARERFEQAARDAGREDYVEFAHALGAHARLEEEVLYPAAILVGRYVARERARR